MKEKISGGVGATETIPSCQLGYQRHRCPMLVVTALSTSTTCLHIAGCHSAGQAARPLPMPEDLNISIHITRLSKAGRHQRFSRDLLKPAFVVDTSESSRIPEWDADASFRQDYKFENERHSLILTILNITGDLNQDKSPFILHVLSLQELKSSKISSFIN